MCSMLLLSHSVGVLVAAVVTGEFIYSGWSVWLVRLAGAFWLALFGWSSSAAEVAIGDWRTRELHAVAAKPRDAGGRVNSLRTHKCYVSDTYRVTSANTTCNIATWATRVSLAGVRLKTQKRKLHTKQNRLSLLFLASTALAHCNVPPILNGAARSPDAASPRDVSLKKNI